MLQSSPELLAALTAWRQRLPRRYSLGVGLPAQLVLQRQLPLPAQPLNEPALGHYVQAVWHGGFSRLNPRHWRWITGLMRRGGSCVSTTERLEVIDQWAAPLLQAGLTPQVFELTTEALKRLAQQAGLGAGSVLVWQQEDRWLWSDAQTAADAGEASSLDALQQQAFPQASQLFVCASQPTAWPATATPFSPLDLLQYKQPPLPGNPGAFALATGLALRAKDC